MTATWGEPKRQANLLKHGFDFADFEACFDADTALYLPTRPSRTGRTRYLLIGEWEGQIVVTVIISPLGSEAIDLVSIRDASDKERAAYEQYRAHA
ncbi:BrnT family toxin [Methylorubrum extorquens]|uniref:BrnT family toxin n=1 Tax=Methylorubrum extorquens DSM 13060 TaxID=882800 RepID=H1KGA6_METEX|nr:BrnT family toxin [Methylorubrum extorquens]EHP93447.1 protein of unknown function DUF497 [Methylorubrum extorquens DSM 13060]